MLISLIAICTALTLSITGILSFWPVVMWYDFYRPIVLLIAGYVLAIALMWIFIDVSGRFISSYRKEYDKPSRFARFLLHSGMAYLNHLARIKIKTVGLDKIPSEPFLLISNHKSNFDPMLVVQVLTKVNIAFISKKEAMKLPLAPRLMWRNCYLPIDRKDRVQSLMQFNRAANLIANKRSSIGVYPEGKRIKDDVIMGDFHHGAFAIAIKTKCPVVVVTMKGTGNIHKNFPRRSHVEMICRVLYYREDYGSMNAKELSDYVHEIIYQELSDK